MKQIATVDLLAQDESKPRMSAIANLATQELKDLIPFLQIKCDDKLMSTIWIIGSFDEEETWKNGALINSKYFRFSIIPKDSQRYYKAGDSITTELFGSENFNNQFKKSTTNPENAIVKIKSWIEATNKLIQLGKSTNREKEINTKAVSIDPFILRQVQAERSKATVLAALRVMQSNMSAEILNMNQFNRIDCLSNQEIDELYKQIDNEDIPFRINEINDK
jgi:hypothetical protein